MKSREPTLDPVTVMEETQPLTETDEEADISSEDSLILILSKVMKEKFWKYIVFC